MGDARNGDNGLRHSEVPRPSPRTAEGRVRRNAMVILVLCFDLLYLSSSNWESIVALSDVMNDGIKEGRTVTSKPTIHRLPHL